MSAMTLRNLDAEVIDELRRRARSEGRSLDSLICKILTREIRAQRPCVEALRERIRRRYGEGTPSEKLVRQDRRR